MPAGRSGWLRSYAGADLIDIKVPMKLTNEFRRFIGAGFAVCLALAPGAKASPCDSIAGKFAKARAASMRAPELCFEGHSCMFGGVKAEAFWTNSDTPDDVRQALQEYSDWIGRITTLPIPHGGGSLIRIERRVGTASCVRDTYLHEVNGRYSLVHSESLEGLSAEATYCGNDLVEVFSDEKGVLIVLAERNTLTLHRLSPSFELQTVCSRSTRPSRGKVR